MREGVCAGGLTEMRKAHENEKGERKKERTLEPGHVRPRSPGSGAKIDKKKQPSLLEFREERAKRRVSSNPLRSASTLSCHKGGNLAEDIREIEHQNHDAAIQTGLYDPLARSVLQIIITSVELFDKVIHG